MDPVTHAASGLLLSQLLPSPSRAGAAIAGLALTFLPDVDYFLVFLDRLTFIRYHRGFTHSLLAVPLFALLVAAAGRLLGGPRWFRPLFFLGLAVLGAHLLLDLATSYGTQVFSPFTRRKFTLDWLFIIDPYFTVLLLAGTTAVWFWPHRGRAPGWFFLAAAGAYFLFCGYCHHRALSLARELYRGIPGENAAAALPQPFSCRRWQLMASGPYGFSQAFVALPFGALWGQPPPAGPTEIRSSPLDQDCRAPAASYDPPGSLVVQRWCPLNRPLGVFPPEARQVVDTFLEFARFPLLYSDDQLGGGRLLKWLDLRFTVPGRQFPFVLQVRLDRGGRLENWTLGRCTGAASNKDGGS